MKSALDLATRFPLLRYEDAEFAGVSTTEADKIVKLVRDWAGVLVK